MYKRIRSLIKSKERNDDNYVIAKKECGRQ